MNPTPPFLMLAAFAVLTAPWKVSADSAVAAEAFPHAIPFESGAAEFAPGDAIAIRSVRGDRPGFELGGRYVVEGTYTLASAPEARIGFSVTTRGRSGKTAVEKEEWRLVKRGTGTFRLVKTYTKEGWPHISYWVNGTSQGGVYFGDGRNPETLLSTKSWSDFGKPGGRQTDAGGSRSDRGSLHPVNAAILHYLGEPVQAPKDLDARYAPGAVETAFRGMCSVAGIRVRRLAVDSSEFPHLVYGVLEGTHEYTVLRTLAASVPGYAYAGSVTRRLSDGSTCLSINLTPYERQPLEYRSAIQRRTLVRLEMLAERVASGAQAGG